MVLAVDMVGMAMTRRLNVTRASGKRDLQHGRCHQAVPGWAQRKTVPNVISHKTRWNVMVTQGKQGSGSSSPSSTAEADPPLGSTFSFLSHSDTGTTVVPVWVLKEVPITSTHSLEQVSFHD